MPEGAAATGPPHRGGPPAIYDGCGLLVIAILLTDKVDAEKIITTMGPTMLISSVGFVLLSFAAVLWVTLQIIKHLVSRE